MVVWLLSFGRFTIWCMFFHIYFIFLILLLLLLTVFVSFECELFSILNNCIRIFSLWASLWMTTAGYFNCPAKQKIRMRLTGTRWRKTTAFDAYFWAKVRDRDGKKEPRKLNKTNHFQMKLVQSLQSLQSLHKSSSMNIKSKWKFSIWISISCICFAWKIVIKVIWWVATADESFFIFHLFHSRYRR